MTPEQIVHKSIATFLDLALTPPDWWTTVPSGGGGKVRGAILKSLGLKVGLPDILLIHHGRTYWLEIKPGKLKAKDYQKACHVRLALAGCAMPLVVHDIVETHDALVQWGFPLRANIWGGGIMKEAAE
jgi:hypothetical protein